MDDSSAIEFAHQLPAVESLEVSEISSYQEFFQGGVS